jgi:nucleotide-binding universal stress UspA family protein
MVVGVDGTPASANALRYALTEAARSGGRVDVFHVIPDHAPIAYPIPLGELMEAGRAALDATLRQVGEAGHGAVGDVVRTHLERGAVVKTLTAVGQTAQAIVVGSDRRPVSMRLLTGNVSTGVAARSSVPVVSVPETWSAARSTGVVLAAVKHPDHSDALMAEAFDVASRSGSRLVVLHAWRFPSAYDDIIVTDPESLAEWGARARHELEELVKPWQHRCPEVDVELRTVHDHSAHALVAASEDADELVIARRAHGFPAAAHLGSTARTVLLYAHCPVRVVPAVPVATMPDLDLEAAGAPLTRATT